MDIVQDCPRSRKRGQAMTEDGKIAEAPPRQPGAWSLEHLFSPSHVQKLLAELVIIIVGVALGMAVTSWNDDRRQQQEVARLIDQLDPELVETLRGVDETNGYYAVTRHYGEQALAGWRGDRSVSDSAFVIGAYQASQIVGTGTNDAAWATIFGSEQLRQIDDPVLRQLLVRVLSASTAGIDVAAADSPYRHNVRRIIPLEIQEAIRAKCGDTIRRGAVIGLPRDCAIDIPADQMASAAATLRKHPDLANDLLWHFANIAGVQLNLGLYADNMRALHDRIAGKAKR